MAEAHLQAVGLPYSLHSNGLEDDLAALVRAANLVTGPGTFAPSAAFLRSKRQP